MNINIESRKPYIDRNRANGNAAPYAPPWQWAQQARLLLMLLLPAAVCVPAWSQSIPPCLLNQLGTIITYTDGTSTTDTYQFAATVGDAVIIICANDIADGALLYDPAGALIAIPVGYLANNTPLPLPEPGIYTIRVTDFTLDLPGTYPYSMSCASVIGQCGILIAYGQSITNYVSSPGTLYVYTFHGNAGDVVTVSTPSVTTDPEMGFYDPQGNSLWQGYGSPGSSNPQTLTQTGTYTVLCFAGGTGTYIISLTCGCSVDVSPLSESDPRWNSTQYNSSTNTIGGLGCGLTSLAMALNYALDRTGSSSAYTPASLNQFMTLKGDFGQAHNVVWGRATRDVGLNDDNNGLLFNTHFAGSSSASDLQEAVCQGNDGSPAPVIVGVNVENGTAHHFVLAVGSEANASGQPNGFYIIDPVDYPISHFSDLSEYGTNFSIRGSVNDPGDLSGFDVDVGNTAELYILDPAGRRTGFDPTTGNIVEEIPSSAYVRDALDDDATGEAATEVGHYLQVLQPQAGTFRLVLVGLRQGQYALSLRAFSRDGSAQPPVLFQGNIDAGQTNSFDVAYNPVVDVQLFGVVKGEQFVQTNASPAIVQPGSPFSFEAFVDAIGGSVNTANLISPNGATNILIAGGSYFGISTNLATEDTLDAMYPNGVYSMTFNTVDNGTNIAVPLSMSGDSYPSNAPHVSNFPTVQNVIPGKDFILTWDPFVGGTTNDYIQVDIGDFFSTPSPGSARALNGTNTFVLVPGSCFLASRTNGSDILFATLTAVNTTNISGSYGFAGYYKKTWFNVVTTPNPPSLGTPMVLPDGCFQFSITGSSGQSYTVQTSTNLFNWVSVMTTNASTNVFYFIDTNARRMPCQFYRVKLGP